ETRLLARGIDDGLYVGAATVLRTALDMAALSFVLDHNHPSGDPTPTPEDEEMTLALRHLASELNVPLKAHVIVTPSGRYAAVHEVALATRSAPRPARCAPVHSAACLQRPAPARISSPPAAAQRTGARGATDRPCGNLLSRARTLQRQTKR
ncbi:JAB domain-containing protein, partial [Sorangium cellulosum]|uniref:JAB domain-containing protein n=1 Tax=Sorangium cellulosum TaxID=56 RepID=UPI000A938336